MRCSRSCYTCVWLLHKSSISLVCEACLLRSMCSILIVVEAYSSYVEEVLSYDRVAYGDTPLLLLRPGVSSYAAILLLCRGDYKENLIRV